MPLFLLLFIKIIVDIINKNLSFNTLNTINLCLLSSLIVFGIFGLLWNTKLTTEKSHIVQIKNATDITDQYFLQYFSLFVLFAVPLDISYINEFCIYLIVLIFIGIVYIKCGLYYINPLLNILGFKFYDVTFKSLETRKLRNVKIFSKETLTKSNYEIKILNDNFAFIVDKAATTRTTNKKQQKQIEQPSNSQNNNDDKHNNIDNSAKNVNSNNNNQQQNEQ